jgi:hypothetical protein
VVASEMYDYQEDPLETKNVADDPVYSVEVRKLKAEMVSFLKAHQEKYVK